jgi:uncharacterized protein YqeY
MSLEQTINEKIKAAMLARDEASLRALRAIKAAILLAKTSEGAPDVLGQDEEMKLLQKMVKQRRDSLEIFQKQQRADLAVKEEEEIAVIEQFLPKPFSPEELKAALQAIIRETGAASPADLGKVMGRASKELAGKAEGKAISEMVRNLLQNPGA